MPKQEQDFIDALKNAITNLPEFKEITNNQNVFACYALMELAVDLVPDYSFLDDAHNEVMDVYLSKVLAAQ